MHRCVDPIYSVDISKTTSDLHLSELASAIKSVFYVPGRMTTIITTIFNETEIT